MSFEGFIELDDIDTQGIILDDIKLPESSFASQAKDNAGVTTDAATQAAAAGSSTPSGESTEDTATDDLLTDEEIAGDLVDTSVLGAFIEDAGAMGIEIPEKASREQISAYGSAYDHILDAIENDRQFKSDEAILRAAPHQLIEKAIRQQDPLIKKSEILTRLSEYLELDESGSPVLDKNGRPVLNEDGQEVYNSILTPVQSRISEHLSRFKKTFEEKYKEAIEARTSLIDSARSFSLKDLPEVDGIKIEELKLPKSYRKLLVDAVRDYNIQGKDTNERLVNAAFSLQETRTFIMQELMRRAAEVATNKILKK